MRTDSELSLKGPDLVRRAMRVALTCREIPEPCSPVVLTPPGRPSVSSAPPRFFSDVRAWPLFLLPEPLFMIFDQDHGGQQTLDYLVDLVLELRLGPVAPLPPLACFQIRLDTQNQFLGGLVFMLPFPSLIPGFLLFLVCPRDAHASSGFGQDKCEMRWFACVFRVPSSRNQCARTPGTAK